MKTVLSIILSVFLCFSAGAYSGPVLLPTVGIQGGLVIGRVATGADIRLDGKQIKQARDGYFVFGLSRDAAAQARLVITWSDGRRLERTIRVKQRRYRIQRINEIGRAHV